MTKLIDPTFAILEAPEPNDFLADLGDLEAKVLDDAIATRATVTAKVFDHPPFTGTISHHRTEPGLLVLTETGPIPFAHTFHNDDLEELTFE